MDIDNGQNSITVTDTKTNVVKDIRDKNLVGFDNQEYRKVFLLKTERLTSALYLVTNFISDTDPVKWSIRRLGVELISDTSAIEDETGIKGQELIYDKVSAKIFGLISLLEISWMGGLISKMNFEILKAEFFNLKKYLDDKFRITRAVSFAVPRDFFSRGEIPALEEKAFQIEKELERTEDRFISSLGASTGAKGEASSFVKDIGIRHMSDTKDSVLEKKVFTQSNPIEKKNIPAIFVSPRPLSLEMSDKNKKKRHDSIVSVLKPGISYSVPEIITLIGMGSELSEKTIQRDLVHLVSAGVLKKTGERRWSRYSLQG